MIVIPTLIFTLSLVSFAASENAWIKKVHYRAEYMVITRAGNYAIKSPNFSQHDWSILYANGLDLVAISSKCKEESFTSGSRAVWLINDIKNRLDEKATKEVCDVNLGRGKLKNYEIISYDEDGSIENILSINMYHDEDEIVIVGEASIFFQEGVLTIVYHDGKIEMKPAVCLTPDEQDLLNRLREAQETQRRVKRRSDRLVESVFDEFISRLSSKRRVQ